MNITTENKTTELSLYCPITPYFFHNKTINDILDIEDESDFYNAKIENGHGAWLDEIKKLLPKSKELLPNLEIYGDQYKDIKTQITSCHLDVEIYNDSAFLVMKYGVTEAVNIELIKKYCTEQLLSLSFAISDQTILAVNDGVLCLEISPVHDYCNNATYESNVDANCILLRNELLGQNSQHTTDDKQISLTEKLRRDAKILRERPHMPRSDSDKKKSRIDR